MGFVVRGVRRLATTASHRPVPAAAAGGAAARRGDSLNLTGVVLVPQQNVYVVERLGKFSKVLGAGLHFLLPLVDRVAYVHSLKEMSVKVESRNAVTSDNVSVAVDGVLFLSLVDASKASYAVHDPVQAMIQHAHVGVGTELARRPFASLLEDRDGLVADVMEHLNTAAADYGVRVRFEIADLTPSPAVRAAIDRELEMERQKRVMLLEAESAREAVLAEAQSEADASRVRATAEAEAIRILADAVAVRGGFEAASLLVADRYVEAFAQLAKKGTTVLVPSPVGDPAGAISQALGIYEALAKRGHAGAAGEAGPAAEGEGVAEEVAAGAASAADSVTGGAETAKREALHRDADAVDSSATSAARPVGELPSYALSRAL